MYFAVKLPLQFNWDLQFSVYIHNKLGAHNSFRITVLISLQRLKKPKNSDVKWIRLWVYSSQSSTKNKAISVSRDNNPSIEFRSHHWRSTRSIIEPFGNVTIFNDVITIRSKCLIFEIHLAWWHISIIYYVTTPMKVYVTVTCV